MRMTTIAATTLLACSVANARTLGDGDDEILSYFEPETYFECAITSQKPEPKKDLNPVDKIGLTLLLDAKDKSFKGLVVTHHTKGGEVYDRGDQYSDARKRQVEHKAKFFWSGSRLKEPSTLMVGYLAMIGSTARQCSGSRMRSSPSMR
jgi:hypothetical protein